MRIQLPSFNSKKDLFSYMVANKGQLIAQKKSMPIVADGLKSMPSIIGLENRTTEAVKAYVGKQYDLPEGTIRVKVVANAANFIDSHKDVLLDDSPAKSIRERKGLIPHLHDHVHTTLAEVGDVVDVLLLDVPLIELGYNMAGATQCVVFITDIRKDYNPKIYDRYKSGRATQHSIGLQYVRLLLCINDEEWPEHQELYNKYIDKIINRGVAEDDGYFWAVPEYKLIENSVVLFGSNMYTPTLEVSEGKSAPASATQIEVPADPIATQKRLQALCDLANKIKSIKN